MKKIISLILSLALLVVAFPIPAFAAENEYVCHNYSDCTKDGSEIFEATKDCVVRAEPTSTSSGKVIGHLAAGDFIAVKETVFNLKRLSRWVRIEYPEGDEVKSAFVFLGNVEKHAHRMSTVMKDGRDSLRACYSCGYAVLESNGEIIISNVSSIIEQCILGDLSDESMTVLSFIARCVSSEFILFDIRDIIVDLYLCKPWYTIGIDVACVIPFISIGKHVAKHSDMLPVWVKNAPKLLKKNLDGAYILGKYKLPEHVLETMLHGNGGLNASKSGIHGAHKLSAFNKSLQNVNGSGVKTIAHPTIKGISNVIEYTFEKESGVFITTHLKKTLYDDSIITDMDMMEHMFDAFTRGPMKVPGSADQYIVKSSNGLWFMTTIDDATQEIKHIYPSFDDLGAKYGIN